MSCGNVPNPAPKIQSSQTVAIFLNPGDSAEIALADSIWKNYYNHSLNQLIETLLALSNSNPCSIYLDEKSVDYFNSPSSIYADPVVFGEKSKSYFRSHVGSDSIAILNYCRDTLCVKFKALFFTGKFALFEYMEEDHSTYMIWDLAMNQRWIVKKFNSLSPLTAFYFVDESLVPHFAVKKDILGSEMVIIEHYPAVRVVNRDLVAREISWNKIIDVDSISISSLNFIQNKIQAGQLQFTHNRKLYNGAAYGQWPIWSQLEGVYAFRKEK